MFNSKKLRRAEGGNLLVIVVAIGILILLGAYMFSKEMATSNAGVITKTQTAIDGGLEELAK